MTGASASIKEEGPPHIPLSSSHPKLEYWEEELVRIIEKVRREEGI